MLSLSLSLYRTSCLCLLFNSSLAQSCFRLRTFALSCMRSLAQLRAHSFLSLLHTNKHTQEAHWTRKLLHSLLRARFLSLSLSLFLSHTQEAYLLVLKMLLSCRAMLFSFSLSLSLSLNPTHTIAPKLLITRAVSLCHTHKCTHTHPNTHTRLKR